jgi:predicted RNase H-like nuclease (RuvC/YqgF family)
VAGEEEGIEMSDTPISDSNPHNVADLGMLCRKLERQLNEANERIKRLEEALESIREYWNRDNNNRAMVDACWYAIDTASEALEAKEAKP